MPAKKANEIMREIKKGDTTFKVRGLTRGEVKQLRADGYNLANLTLDQAEEAVDAAFDLVFSENEIRIIDALPNRDAMEIWRAVLAETYGSGDEEKNLPTSGTGTQTQNE